MFQNKSSEQAQSIEAEYQGEQGAFSESMMIGEINLECDQNPNAEGSSVENKQVIPEANKSLCSECAFEKTIELTQEILELRDKLKWYEGQTNELEKLGKADQQVLKVLMKPMQMGIDKQLKSQEEAQTELKYLEKQLASIEEQLQKEEALTQQYQNSIKQFVEERQQFQEKVFKNQTEFIVLARRYHEELVQNYNILKKTITLFETTNFVTLLYTITFENNRSFLNGEKITHQNIWKLVQIVLFYQTKYDSFYHPLYLVTWDQLKLQKDHDQHIDDFGTGNLLESINLGSLLRKESVKEADIDCSSEEIVLGNWMPCLLLETRHLFSFVNKQAKKQQKMRYEISREGQFEALRGKSFKNTKQKFNLTVKYLMTNLDQINKIQFFARDNRITSQ